MSACWNESWRMISYEVLPDFWSLENFEGYYYNYNIPEWNYILFNESILNILLNFPLNLEKYTNLNYSDTYCFSWYEEYSITLSNLSFLDTSLITINILIMLLPIFGIILVFKKGW